MEVFVEIGKGISTLGLIAISSVMLLVILLVLKDIARKLRQRDDEETDLDVDEILTSTEEESDSYWDKLIKHYDAGRTEAENETISLHVETLRTALVSEQEALTRKIRNLIMARVRILFVSLECIAICLLISMLIGTIGFIVNWSILQTFTPDYALSTRTIFLSAMIVGIVLIALSEMCCAIKLVHLAKITQKACHRYGYVQSSLKEKEVRDADRHTH